MIIMNKEELLLIKIAVQNELQYAITKMSENKHQIEEYIKWKNLYNKYFSILKKLGY